jgi:hypothetical protein
VRAGFNDAADKLDATAKACVADLSACLDRGADKAAAATKGFRRALLAVRRM